MSPFEAIQYVGTPIALVAFIVAVGAYVYRSRLVERRKLIEAAPESDRGRLLDRTIQELGPVEPGTLNREQRYQLALRLIEDRAARFRTTALLGAGTAVLLAGVVLALPASSADDPLRLVVRVDDVAAGTFMRAGRITLDAGAGRDTRPIGEDGQVRFDNVPRAAFEHGVSLIPDVPGYARTVITLHEPPENGVHYLRLERAGSELYGTVITPDRVPLEGVVLIFGDGVAADTTDAGGTFRVAIPYAPGERIPVRATRDGNLGLSDMVTVPDGAGLTLFFEART